MPDVVKKKIPIRSLTRSFLKMAVKRILEILILIFSHLRVFETLVRNTSVDFDLFEKKLSMMRL
jgi:hypothetical protein